MSDQSAAVPWRGQASFARFPAASTGRRPPPRALVLAGPRLGLGLLAFDLQPEPRFRLSTIHGAKGREADVVVLIPDMTRATQTEYLCGGSEGEEAENRVAYVAVTRARKGLVIVEPQTRRSYPYWRLLPRRGDARPAVSPNGGTQALPT